MMMTTKRRDTDSVVAAAVFARGEGTSGNDGAPFPAADIYGQGMDCAAAQCETDFQTSNVSRAFQQAADLQL